MANLPFIITDEARLCKGVKWKMNVVVPACTAREKGHYKNLYAAAWKVLQVYLYSSNEKTFAAMNVNSLKSQFGVGTF